MPKVNNDQFSKDFLTRFREEVDYLREVENQNLFLESWKGSPQVLIPAPIAEFCRRRVLVTEFHSGKSFAEIAASSEPRVKSAYGETLFWFVCHSILSYGLFSADPHPGNQKSGLNRSILRQGWGNFRIMMDYKTKWYGSHLILVNPQNTSRRCGQCGYIHEDNRQTQADFLCQVCGHDENADKNAANNIRRLGLESLGHKPREAPSLAC